MSEPSSIELELPNDDDKTNVYTTYPSKEEQIQEEKRWIKLALYVCVIAFTFTITSAITGITVGVINNSSTFLAFGLDASCDIMAGSFIIWRFAGKANTQKEIDNIQHKEKRASIGIAFALILVAIITAVQSIVHLIDQVPPVNDTLLFTVSSVLGFLLLIVAVIKFFIAHKLKSLALQESGVTNISGFFLSVGVIIANVAFAAIPSVWYLDATFAIFISALLGGFGVHTLVTKRAEEWWKKVFWFPQEPEVIE